MNEQHGLEAQFSFLVDQQSRQNMSSTLSWLENLEAQFTKTANAVGGNAIAESFREMATSAAQGRGRVSREIGGMAASAQKGLKPLREEFRALKAEARLVNFGSYLDPKDGKRAANQIKQITRSMKELENQIGRDTAAEREFFANVKRGQQILKDQVALQKEASAAARAAENVGTFGAIANVGKNVIVPFKNQAIDAIGVLNKLETQINAVQAVTGATGKDRETLRNEAKKLGAATEFTAGQAAEAEVLLGQAGFKTDAILKGLRNTLSLASAGQMEMAQSADILVSTFAAFQFQAQDADKQTLRIANALSLAAADTNTGVGELGEALKYAATPAKAFNLTLEETVALLGTASNIGIKASSAGTGLRSGLVNLLNPKYMDKLKSRFGVDTLEKDGSTRNIMDIMTDLSNSINKGARSPEFLKAVQEQLGDFQGTAEEFDAKMGSLQDKFPAYGKALGDMAAVFGKESLSFWLGQVTQVDKLKQEALTDIGAGTDTRTLTMMMFGVDPNDPKVEKGIKDAGGIFRMALKQAGGSYTDAKAMIQAATQITEYDQVSLSEKLFGKGSYQNIIQSGGIFKNLIGQTGSYKEALKRLDDAIASGGVAKGFLGMGAAARMAETQQQGLTGALNGLSSAIEAFQIAFLEPLEPVLVKAINLFSGLLRFLSSLPAPVRLLISTTGMLVVSLAAIASVGGAAAVAVSMFSSSLATANVSALALQKGTLPLTGFFGTAMSAFSGKAFQPAEALKSIKGGVKDIKNYVLDFSTQLPLAIADSGILLASLRTYLWRAFTGIPALLGEVATGFLGVARGIAIAGRAVLLSPWGIAITSIVLLSTTLESLMPSVNLLATLFGVVIAPAGFVIGLVKGITKELRALFSTISQGVVGRAVTPWVEHLTRSFQLMLSTFESFSARGEALGKLIVDAIAMPIMGVVGAIVQKWDAAFGFLRSLLTGFNQFAEYIGGLLVHNLAHNSPGPLTLIQARWSDAITVLSVLLQGFGWVASLVGQAIAAGWVSASVTMGNSMGIVLSTSESLAVNVGRAAGSALTKLIEFAKGSVTVFVGQALWVRKTILAILGSVLTTARAMAPVVGEYAGQVLSALIASLPLLWNFLKAVNAALPPTVRLFLGLGTAIAAIGTAAWKLNLGGIQEFVAQIQGLGAKIAFEMNLIKSSLGFGGLDGDYSRNYLYDQFVGVLPTGSIVQAIGDEVRLINTAFDGIGKIPADAQDKARTQLLTQIENILPSRASGLFTTLANEVRLINAAFDGIGTISPEVQQQSLRILVKQLTKEWPATLMSSLSWVRTAIGDFFDKIFDPEKGRLDMVGFVALTLSSLPVTMMEQLKPTAGEIIPFFNNLLTPGMWRAVTFGLPLGVMSAIAFGFVQKWEAALWKALQTFPSWLKGQINELFTTLEAETQDQFVKGFQSLVVNLVNETGLLGDKKLVMPGIEAGEGMVAFKDALEGIHRSVNAFIVGPLSILIRYLGEVGEVGKEIGRNLREILNPILTFNLYDAMTFVGEQWLPQFQGVIFAVRDALQVISPVPSALRLLSVPFVMPMLPVMLAFRYAGNALADIAASPGLKGMLSFVKLTLQTILAQLNAVAAAVGYVIKSLTIYPLRAVLSGIKALIISSTESIVGSVQAAIASIPALITQYYPIVINAIADILRQIPIIGNYMANTFLAVVKVLEVAIPRYFNLLLNKLPREEVRTAFEMIKTWAIALKTGLMYAAETGILPALRLIKTAFGALINPIGASMKVLKLYFTTSAFRKIFQEDMFSINPLDFIFGSTWQEKMPKEASRLSKYLNGLGIRRSLAIGFAGMYDAVVPFNIVEEKLKMLGEQATTLGMRVNEATTLRVYAQDNINNPNAKKYLLNLSKVIDQSPGIAKFVMRTMRLMMLLNPMLQILGRIAFAWSFWYSILKPMNREMMITLGQTQILGQKLSWIAYVAKDGKDQLGWLGASFMFVRNTVIGVADALDALYKMLPVLWKIANVISSSLAPATWLLFKAIGLLSQFGANSFLGIGKAIAFIPFTFMVAARQVLNYAHWWVDQFAAVASEKNIWAKIGKGLVLGLEASFSVMVAMMLPQVAVIWVLFNRLAWESLKFVGQKFADLGHFIVKVLSDIPAAFRWVAAQIGGAIAVVSAFTTRMLDQWQKIEQKNPLIKTIRLTMETFAVFSAVAIGVASALGLLSFGEVIGAVGTVTSMLFVFFTGFTTEMSWMSAFWIGLRVAIYSTIAAIADLNFGNFGIFSTVLTKIGLAVDWLTHKIEFLSWILNDVKVGNWFSDFMAGFAKNLVKFMPLILVGIMLVGTVIKQSLVGGFLLMIDSIKGAISSTVNLVKGFLNLKNVIGEIATKPIISLDNLNRYEKKVVTQTTDQGEGGVSYEQRRRVPLNLGEIANPFPLMLKKWEYELRSRTKIFGANNPFAYSDRADLQQKASYLGSQTEIIGGAIRSNKEIKKLFETLKREEEQKFYQKAKSNLESVRAEALADRTSRTGAVIGAAVKEMKGAFGIKEYELTKSGRISVEMQALERMAEEVRKNPSQYKEYTKLQEAITRLHGQAPDAKLNSTLTELIGKQNFGELFEQLNERIAKLASKDINVKEMNAGVFRVSRMMTVGEEGARGNQPVSAEILKQLMRRDADKIQGLFSDLVRSGTHVLYDPGDGTGEQRLNSTQVMDSLARLFSGVEKAKEFARNPQSMTGSADNLTNKLRNQVLLDEKSEYLYHTLFDNQIAAKDKVNSAYEAMVSKINEEYRTRSVTNQGRMQLMEGAGPRMADEINKQVALVEKALADLIFEAFGSHIPNFKDISSFEMEAIQAANRIADGSDQIAVGFQETLVQGLRRGGSDLTSGGKGFFRRMFEATGIPQFLSARNITNNLDVEVAALNGRAEALAATERINAARDRAARMRGLSNVMQRNNIPGNPDVGSNDDSLKNRLQRDKDGGRTYEIFRQFMEGGNKNSRFTVGLDDKYLAEEIGDYMPQFAGKGSPLLALQQKLTEIAQDKTGKFGNFGDKELVEFRKAFATGGQAWRDFVEKVSVYEEAFTSRDGLGFNKGTKTIQEAMRDFREHITDPAFGGQYRAEDFASVIGNGLMRSARPDPAVIQHIVEKLGLRNEAELRNIDRQAGTDGFLGAWEHRLSEWKEKLNANMETTQVKVNTGLTTFLTKIRLTGLIDPLQHFAGTFVQQASRQGEQVAGANAVMYGGILGAWEQTQLKMISFGERKIADMRKLLASPATGKVWGEFRKEVDKQKENNLWTLIREKGDWFAQDFIKDNPRNFNSMMGANLKEQDESLKPSDILKIQAAMLAKRKSGESIADVLKEQKLENKVGVVARAFAESIGITVDEAEKAIQDKNFTAKAVKPAQQIFLEHLGKFVKAAAKDLMDFGKFFGSVPLKAAGVALFGAVKGVAKVFSFIAKDLAKGFGEGAIAKMTNFLKDKSVGAIKWLDKVPVIGNAIAALSTRITKKIVDGLDDVAQQLDTGGVSWIKTSLTFVLGGIATLFKGVGSAIGNLWKEKEPKPPKPPRTGFMGLGFELQDIDGAKIKQSMLNSKLAGWFGVGEEAKKRQQKLQDLEGDRRNARAAGPWAQANNQAEFMRVKNSSALGLLESLLMKPIALLAKVLPATKFDPSQANSFGDLFDDQGGLKQKETTFRKTLIEMKRLWDSSATAIGPLGTLFGKAADSIKEKWNWLKTEFKRPDSPFHWMGVQAYRATSSIRNSFLRLANSTQNIWGGVGKGLAKIFRGIATTARKTGYWIKRGISHGSGGPATDVQQIWSQEVPAGVQPGFDRMEASAQASGRAIAGHMGEAAKQTNEFFVHSGNAMKGLWQVGVGAGAAISAAGFGMQTLGYSLSNLGLIDEGSPVLTTLNRMGEVMSIFGVVGSVLSPLLGVGINLFAVMASTIGAVTAGVTGLGGAIAGVIGLSQVAFAPFILGIAAVGVAIAGIYVAFKNNFLGIRNLVGDLVSILAIPVEFISNAWHNLARNFAGILSPLITTAMSIRDKLVMLLNHGSSDTVSSAWVRARESVTGSIEGMVTAAKSVMPTKQVGAIASNVGSTVTGGVSGAWEGLTNIGQQTVNFLGQILSSLNDIRVTLMDQAADKLAETSEMAQAAVSAIATVGKEEWDKSGLANALKTFKPDKIGLGDKFMGLFNHERGFNLGVKESVQQRQASLATEIYKGANSDNASLKQKFGGMLTTDPNGKQVINQSGQAYIEQQLADEAKSRKGIFSVENLKEIAGKTGFTGANPFEAAMNGMTNLRDVVNSLPQTMESAFSNMIEGIKAIPDTITSVMQTIWDKLQEAVVYLKGIYDRTITGYKTNLAKKQGKGAIAPELVMGDAIPVKMSNYVKPEPSPTMAQNVGTGAAWMVVQFRRFFKWRAAFEERNTPKSWKKTRVGIGLESEATNSQNAWQRTMAFIGQGMTNLVGEMQPKGHDLQAAISEGSPGPSFFTRENWDKTFTHIADSAKNFLANPSIAGLSDKLQVGIEGAKKAWQDFSRQGQPDLTSNSLMAALDVTDSLPKVAKKKSFKESLDDQLKSLKAFSDQAFVSLEERYDYLKEHGIGSVGDLMLPGIQQVSRSVSILGGDIADFAKRSVMALVRLDFKEMGQAVKDFGGNAVYAFQGIADGIGNASLSLLAFFSVGLGGFVPFVLAFGVIAFTSAVLIANFLGMRTILKGFFQVAIGGSQLVAAAFTFLVEVTHGLLVTIKGLWLAMTQGDFSELIRGTGLIKKAFENLEKGILKGLGTISKGIKTIFRGLLEGFNQLSPIKVNIDNFFAKLKSYFNLFKDGEMLGRTLASGIIGGFKSIIQGAVKIQLAIQNAIDKAVDNAIASMKRFWRSTMTLFKGISFKKLGDLDFKVVGQEILQRASVVGGLLWLELGKGIQEGLAKLPNQLTAPFRYLQSFLSGFAQELITELGLQPTLDRMKGDFENFVVSLQQEWSKFTLVVESTFGAAWNTAIATAELGWKNFTAWVSDNMPKSKEEFITSFTNQINQLEQKWGEFRNWLTNTGIFDTAFTAIAEGLLTVSGWIDRAKTAWVEFRDNLTSDKIDGVISVLERLRDGLFKVSDWVSKVSPQLGNWLLEIPVMIDRVIPLIQKSWENLSQFLRTTDLIPDFLGLMQWAAKKFSEGTDLLKEVWGKFIGWMKSDNAGNLFANLFEGLRKFGEKLPDMTADFRQKFSTFFGELKQEWGVLSQSFPVIFEAEWKKLTEQAELRWTQLVDFIQSAWKNLGAFFSQEDLLGKLFDSAGDLRERAKVMMEGIYQEVAAIAAQISNALGFGGPQLAFAGVSAGGGSMFSQLKQDSQEAIAGIQKQWKDFSNVFGKKAVEEQVREQIQEIATIGTEVPQIYEQAAKASADAWDQGLSQMPKATTVRMDSVEQAVKDGAANIETASEVMANNIVRTFGKLNLDNSLDKFRSGLEKGFGDNLEPAIAGLRTSFVELGGTVVESATRILAIPSAVQELSGQFSSVKPEIEGVTASITQMESPLVKVGQLIGGLTVVVADFSGKIIGGLGDAIAYVTKFATDFFGEFTQKITPAIENLLPHVSKLKNILGGLASILKGVGIGMAAIAAVPLAPVLVPLYALFKHMKPINWESVNRFFNELGGNIGNIAGTGFAIVIEAITRTIDYLDKLTNKFRDFFAEFSKLGSVQDAVTKAKADPLGKVGEDIATTKRAFGRFFASDAKKAEMDWSAASDNIKNDIETAMSLVKASAGQGSEAVEAAFKQSALNVKEKWGLTTTSIDAMTEALSEQMKKHGYDIQHHIAEGSPGTTERIRKYWGITTEYIASQMQELNATAARVGAGIQGSFERVTFENARNGVVDLQRQMAATDSPRAEEQRPNFGSTRSAVTSSAAALSNFAPQIATPVFAGMDIVDAIADVKQAFPDLKKNFAWFMTSIPTFLSSIPALFATIGAAIAGPLLPVIVIIGAIAAGVAALRLAWKINFMDIRGFVNQFWQAIAGVFGVFWRELQAIGRSIMDLIKTALFPLRSILALFGTTLGGLILTGVRLVASAISNVIVGISKLIQGLIMVAKVALIAIAPFRIFNTIVKVQGFLTVLPGLLSGVGAATTAMASSNAIAAGSFVGLASVGATSFSVLGVAATTAWALISGPLLPLIALGSALFLVWKVNFLGLRTLVQGVFEVIIGFFKGLWDSAMIVFNAFGSAFSEIGAAFGEFGKVIGEAISPILEIFGLTGEAKDSFFGQMFSMLKSNLLAGLLFPIKLVAFTLGGIIKTVGSLIAAFIKVQAILLRTVLAPIRFVFTVLKSIVQLLSGDFGGAWKTFSGGFVTFAETFRGIFTGLGKVVLDLLMSLGRNLVTTITGVFSSLPNILQRVLGGLASFVGSIFSNAIAAILNSLPAPVKSALSNIPGVGGMITQAAPVPANAIQKFATGGRVIGPGTGTSDSIHAMLSNNEFVVNADAASRNLGLLETINNGGEIPRAVPIPVPHMTKPPSGGGYGSTKGATSVAVKIEMPVTIQVQGGSGEKDPTVMAEEIIDQLMPMLEWRMPELFQRLRERS